MCSRNKLLAMDKIFCPGQNVFCLGQYFFVWDKIDFAWDKIYFVLADGMGISSITAEKVFLHSVSTRPI